MTYDARTQGFESYDATGFVANQLGLNYWTDTAAQGGFYKRTEYTAGGTSNLAAECGALAYALDSGIAGGGTPVGDADVRSRDFLGGDVQTRPSLALANQLLCAHQNGSDLAGIAAMIKMRGYQGAVAPDDASLATPEPLGFGFTFWKDTSTTPAVVKIKDAAGGWAPAAMHVNTVKAGLWNGCDFIALWDTDADAAINPGTACTWLPDGAGGYDWAAAVAQESGCPIPLDIGSSGETVFEFALSDPNCKSLGVCKIDTGETLDDYINSANGSTATYKYTLEYEFEGTWVDMTAPLQSLWFARPWPNWEYRNRMLYQPGVIRAQQAGGVATFLHFNNESIGSFDATYEEPGTLGSYSGYTAGLQNGILDGSKPFVDAVVPAKARMTSAVPIYGMSYYEGIL